MRRRRQFWLANVALLGIASPLAQAQLSFLNAWGTSGSASGQFINPTGVAVGSGGLVYAVDSGNNRIEVFNATGAFQSTFGASTLNSPGGDAIGSGGNLYVADTFNNRIDVFNTAGSLLNTFSTFGSAAGDVDLPEDVAASSTTGNIYVADTNNSRIDVFNSAGTYQSTFGASGTGNGQFASQSPSGLTVSPLGAIVATDPPDNRVELFTSSGSFQKSFGAAGAGNGQFNVPLAIAAGPSGLLYVADAANNRIEVFSASGAFQSAFGSIGTGNGQFDFPNALAVTSTGMVYVSDYYNSRIVRLFDPNSWSSGTDVFTDPTVGPTSLSVGPGQILGTSLTLFPTMGLTVGNTLTINSGGTLIMAGGSLSANSLTVSSGGILQLGNGLAIGAINAPITSNGSINVQAGNSSSPVVVGNIAGNGSLTIGTSSSPAFMQLAPSSGTSTISSLTINPGSSLDIANNSLAINYTGSTPLPAVEAALATGYNSGAWDGPGIISSTAASTSGAYALGYADNGLQPGQVLIQYTLVGDANLDGTVNLTDLLALLNSYGQSGADWSQGDFNYDGSVNLTDLLALLNNYGQSVSSASLPSTTAVPEPAAPLLLMTAGAFILTRSGRSPTRHGIFRHVNKSAVFHNME